MNLPFEKYQASGNDFILINQYNNNFLLNKKKIGFLCDRNLGVGADGLIIIRNTAKADFEMKFGGGVLAQASVVDGVRFSPNTGTMSGTIKLYGVK